MSTILPPAERLWWKHPLDRVEGTWIAIAFVWCMIMFFMMVYWHIYGDQNLSTETYKTRPEQFVAKAQAMVDKYTVRTETDSAHSGRGAAPEAMCISSRGCGELLADHRIREGPDLSPASHVHGL